MLAHPVVFKKIGIRKDVLRLVIPILIEQILINSMGLINTMMASRLKGEEGAHVVAAISMIDSISNLLIAFFSALAIGGTVVVAQYVGRKDLPSANEGAKQALFSGLSISLVLTVILFIFKMPLLSRLFGDVEPIILQYGISYLSIVVFSFPLLATLLIGNGILRGAGNTSTSASVNILMNACNITFTYYFLYIAKLGIIGAALGITLARLVGAIYVLFVLAKGKQELHIENYFSFKPNSNLLKQIFYVGIPASVESLVFHVGKLLTQTFIGQMGTTAMLSNSIANSITNMLNIPGNSLSTAATTVVGQSIGRGNSEEAKQNLSYMTKLALICLVALALLTLPFLRVLVALFTDNAQALAYTTQILKLNALAIPLWAFSFVLPAGLKGAGDGTYTMMTSMFGMWAFRVGLGYILGITLKIGVAGVFIAMYIDWGIRGFLYYLRFKGTKWLNHEFTKKSA